MQVHIDKKSTSNPDVSYVLNVFVTLNTMMHPSLLQDDYSDTVGPEKEDSSSGRIDNKHSIGKLALSVKCLPLNCAKMI